MVNIGSNSWHWSTMANNGIYCWVNGYVNANWWLTWMSKTSSLLVVTCSYFVLASHESIIRVTGENRRKNDHRPLRSPAAGQRRVLGKSCTSEPSLEACLLIELLPACRSRFGASRDWPYCRIIAEAKRALKTSRCLCQFHPGNGILATNNLGELTARGRLLH